MTDKVVGVIGGMGPEATVDLMMRVIRATPAEDDIDHIRMFVDNNPNPDKPEPKRSLAKAHQSSQRKIMKRYLHETQHLCRSKKLKRHSFLGNLLYYWLSGHCKKFLMFLAQDSIVNCLMRSARCCLLFLCISRWIN